MICFEVQKNGKVLCTAGVGDLGVVSTILTRVKRDPADCPEGLDKKEWCEERVDLHVGGSTSDGEEGHLFLDWIKEQPISVGDEITIRILDRPLCDPATATRRDTAQDIRTMKQQYYEAVKKEIEEEQSRSRIVPNRAHLERAAEYWRGGQTLEAGRLIHDNLPTEARPAWAAKILRLVLDRSGADRSHFIRILETADHPRWWANGHRCFDLLRDETLKFDEVRRKRGLTKNQEEFAHLLSLAELVAKVTYNAADPPDPFDEDSGWYIAASLRGYVDMWKDEEFSKAAWAALCCEE